MTVAIIPAVEGGAFLAIGDTLTIFDAAMIYADRHPASEFLRGASLSEAEQFLGREQRRGCDNENAARRKLSWDIYCELMRRVESGKIKPVRTGSLPSGEIDPRETAISIACLAELARERGDKPEFLKPLIEEPPAQLVEEPPSPQLVEEPPPRTGMQGRPSIMSPELLEEMTARAAHGKLKATLCKEVSELLAWFAHKHPTWPCPKPGTAKNKLRDPYKQLKASTK